MAMMGCGQPSTQGEPGAGGASAGADGYTIAVIPKGLAHQFWLTVKAGAEAAGEEFGAEIVWNGPEKETMIAKQINIIEDMRSRGVDAIVMAACDENALIDTIKSAMDAGTPVVTIDSGVKSDLPVSFVATDNVAAARQAADVLAGFVGGTGAVGQLPFVPGAATSEMREQGFREGIEALDGVDIVSTIHTHSDVAKALAATEDMVTANPEIKGIFCGNEAAAIGAVQALESMGKAGAIKMVAFDASPEEVDALKRGTIHALVVQDPFKMGYEGVKAAIDTLEGRPVEKRIDTGVAIVTMESFEDPDIQKLLYPIPE